MTTTCLECANYHIRIPKTHARIDNCTVLDYRVYPSHTPELERPLHSRDKRLSRSERLSAEPSWKLIFPPLDFLAAAVFRGFFDPFSLLALISIARPATEKVAACAVLTAATEAATASTALAHKVRSDVAIRKSFVIKPPRSGCRASSAAWPSPLRRAAAWLTCRPWQRRSLGTCGSWCSSQFA
jgi:hypothetical protein